MNTDPAAPDSAAFPAPGAAAADLPLAAQLRALRAERLALAAQIRELRRLYAAEPVRGLWDSWRRGLMGDAPTSIPQIH